MYISLSFWTTDTTFLSQPEKMPVAAFLQDGAL